MKKSIVFILMFMLSVSMIFAGSFGFNPYETTEELVQEEVVETEAEEVAEESDVKYKATDWSKTTGTEKDYPWGKLVIGGLVGYYPTLERASFEAAFKWMVDYAYNPEFTTDLVFNAGLFPGTEDTLMNIFFGAGLTKALTNKWNVVISAGLDMLLADGKDADVGVGVNAGFGYYMTDECYLSINTRTSSYVKSGMFTFRPSIGCSYAF